MELKVRRLKVIIPVLIAGCPEEKMRPSPSRSVNAYARCVLRRDGRRKRLPLRVISTARTSAALSGVNAMSVSSISRK